MSTENSEFSLAAIEEAAAKFFDTRAPFEKWLHSLEPEVETVTEVGDFDCEVIFAGVLRVDGLIRGHIRSAHGTLVMSEHGRVEADVDVRTAIIDGYLEGTLRATEYVVLNSTARVAGDIHTSSLTINDGAVFEGNSYFLERRIYSEIYEVEGESDAQMAMAVGV
jgi:cytoskeletal protein CcmA (bactofilin family)